MVKKSEKEIKQGSSNLKVDGGVNGSKAKITRRKRGPFVKKKAATTTTATEKKFRGVTKQKSSGRFEAHIWNHEAWNDGIRVSRGKQVYLGAHNEEIDAARTHDLAAIKFFGNSAITNFPVEEYKDEIEKMKNMTNAEFVLSTKRKSTGFSRGASKYRGVARHHGRRWEARIGGNGKKYRYLGVYDTEEEAAVAYDRAARATRGASAVTNFKWDADGNITGEGSSSNGDRTSLDVSGPSNTTAVSEGNPNQAPSCSSTSGHQTFESAAKSADSIIYKVPDLNIALEEEE